MSNQALLLMDFQNVTLGAVGGDDSPQLAQAVKAAEAARAANVPVVFVRVAFRPGYPELSSYNQGMAPIANYGDVFVETEPTAQIHASLNVTDKDIVVTKRRVGAFSGTDLSSVLSGLGVTDLVLAGVTTGQVVLATFRQAADSDFGLTVLSDASGDAEPDVHDFLVERIFPAAAKVTTTDEWISSL